MRSNNGVDCLFANSKPNIRMKTKAVPVKGERNLCVEIYLVISYGDDMEIYTAVGGEAAPSIRGMSNHDKYR